MYHKVAIEGYPLQAYASALLFSPTGSLIRRFFQHEEPKGVYILPTMSDDWSACLQTFEGHSSTVNSVVFSHDSTRLASASWDRTVKVWDANSGMCLQTLEGHSSTVSSVVFSHDSMRLASASHDGTVKIWDASSGLCLQTLEWNGDSVSSTDLVSILASLHPNKTVTESQRPDSQGSAISLDDIWVSDNAQNLLWLPTEYRPACLAMSSRCVGIGTGSGKIWLCCFLQRLQL
jgi:WD40 repeat protein